jgi:hypothetical protein
MELVVRGQVITTTAEYPFYETEDVKFLNAVTLCPILQFTNNVACGVEKIAIYPRVRPM